MTTGSQQFKNTKASRISRIRSMDRGLLVLVVFFVLLLPAVTTRIYGADEIQYFSYLRSFWFDQNLDFTNEYMHFYESNPQKYAAFKQDLIDKREETTGLPLNVAPIGSAIMWAPFFAAGDLAVHVMRAFGSNVQADGYSAPYITAITYGSAIYGFLGLIFTYLLARSIFSRFASSLGTIVVWLATPAFFYMYITPPMSHANSLFAVALFIYIWYRTRGDRKLWQWAALGASAALMTLVREQDALFMIIPALEWLLNVVHSLRGRDFSRFRGLAGGALAFGATAFVLYIPQLITYRILTGHFGPSSHVTEKLLWNSPFSFDVLFSPEHGLFAWTPVAILAVIGLVALYRRDPQLAVLLAIAFLAQVYIAGAYKTWSMAGSFGARRFVNCSLIFGLGLAALVDLADRRVPRWALGTIGAVFVAWNFGLIMQFSTEMMARQALDLPKVIHNQFFEVPQRALSLVDRFLFNRSSFYKNS
ncbi:MAG: glycosyltransferase family 39 protein [Chloroflexi bacterium]|nr:glycosyltransferase family 39 protein [Chloroflexota bacterium]